MWHPTTIAKERVMWSFMGLMAVYAGLLGSTWSGYLAPYAGTLPAATGVSVGVEPTTLNTKAAALAQKEHELVVREQELAEAAPLSRPTEAPLPIIYTTLVGIMLLALVLLNFYLDFRRRPGYS